MSGLGVSPYVKTILESHLHPGPLKFADDTVMSLIEHALQSSKRQINRKVDRAL